jgi:hypothetical protein
MSLERGFLPMGKNEVFCTQACPCDHLNEAAPFYEMVSAVPGVRVLENGVEEGIPVCTNPEAPLRESVAGKPDELVMVTDRRVCQIHAERIGMMLTTEEPRSPGWGN